MVLKVAVSAVLLWLLFRQTDPAALWAQFKSASPLWLAAALLLYLAMIGISAWRWGLLLDTQALHVPVTALGSSYLVATFFNNFLPSNIGGDVVRVTDTAGVAGSKTRAATVVLVDRAIGLVGLLLVAACGASLVHAATGLAAPVPTPLLWLAFVAGVAGLGLVVLFPGMLPRLLSPLRAFHAEWVEERLARLASTFEGFRERPRTLVACFVGAVIVQAMLVVFYGAVARSVRIPVPLLHLAVLVPVSFVVQMLPVSMNGFGVREATFTYYFRQLGLPIESALVLSLLATATVMAFSLSGAAVYVTRR